MTTYRVHLDAELTADLVADGEQKRILTLDEIAALQGGGGGLPEGTTLEEIPDGATRVAVAPGDLTKLAAYSVNDGKTGDAHALIVTGNPHQVTAEDVGAPTTAAFTSLVSDVEDAADAIEALDTRVDTLESTASTHTSDISALDTRLDNLEGDAEQWVHLPPTVRNSQVFTNMPAGPSAWTNTMYRKVSLWKAKKIFFYASVGAADTNTNAAVRHQYTTDLSGATGWTDFSGADVAVGTVSQAGVQSSIIDVPSGAKTQEFVLYRAAGVNGNGTQSPTISFASASVLVDAIGAPGTGSGAVDSFNGRTGTVNPATDDYSYDQIAETSTGKKFTATLKTKLDGIEAGAEVNDVASVHGRTGAITAQSGDYTTAQLTESTDKKFVTDAEKAKLANVPSDTNASLAAKANASDVTTALAAKADDAATTTALAAKAPLASPALTGTPTAPTPTTTDNTTKIATTAFVKAQPVASHTHASAADIIGLPATLSAMQADIALLSSGGEDTRVVLTITSTTAVNLPDNDVIFIEHTTNANVRIPASLSKKGHILVFIGNPNTVNVMGATGSNQTIKGATASGLTFASGTDAAAVTRVLIPDPDATNFPNRWRIF